MKRIFLTVFTVILMSILIVGCGKANMEGIILEVTENVILLSENISPEEYEEVKNESVSKLQNEDVQGERARLGLIELTYDNTDKFSKGDEVEVWIDGDILESYPSQAKAKKISLKK